MVSIRPATVHPDELARLAEIQRAAFANSAIERHVFGSVTDDDYRANVAQRLSKAIEDPKQAVWEAVVDGKVVGSALWGLPHEFEEDKDKDLTEEERLKKVKERFPTGADYILGDQFFRAIDLNIKEPHMHLSVLVVDPATQRTGAGSALLRWGAIYADKHGVESYLEATEVGIPVYKKHGYKLFREPIRAAAPHDDMVLYPMRRPALVVKPATTSQLDKIAELHRAAFAPTLWFNSLWGKVKPGAFDAWYIEDVKRWMQDDHFLVAVRDEEVLGIAHWEEKEGPETPSEVEPVHPEGTNLPVALAFSRDMRRYTSTIQGRYWHLHILAASPPRTGAGRALVQWGLDRAQKEGLPVYLEGGSEALPFYDTFGFEKCAPEVAGIDGSFADTPLVRHPLVVVPPTTEDLPIISSLHRESFWPSEHYKIMFSNVKHEDYDRWNLKRIQKWQREDLADRHWTVVAKRGDTILGYGHAELGGIEQTVEVEADFATLPEGSNVAAGKKFSSALDAAEKKIPGRYLMLHQLCTSPRHQKTGAGKAVLDWFIKKAHSLDLDLYLDSTPEGRRLYDSMGCEQWAPTLVLEEGTDLKTYPMVARRPRPSSSNLPLTLSSATPNDIPHLAIIFREAFEPLDIFQRMFSGTEPSVFDRWNEARLGQWIGSAEASAGTSKQIHWTIVARRGDELVGFGHWELHGLKKNEGEEELEPVPLPETIASGDAGKIFTTLHAASAKIEGEFYMLHQLAINPRLQKTGAGRALVGWGVELAEKGGHQALYLDSVSAARGLYEKLGFVHWDEPTTVGEGWPKTYPMVYKGVEEK